MLLSGGRVYDLASGEQKDDKLYQLEEEECLAFLSRMSCACIYIHTCIYIYT